MRYQAYTSTHGETHISEIPDRQLGPELEDQTYPTVGEALDAHERELEEGATRYQKRLAALRLYRRTRPLEGQGSLFPEEEQCP